MRRRAKSFSDADAQIFFQPGEGAFKGVVVLPVREIGDVIFADCFRQIFSLLESSLSRQRCARRFGSFFFLVCLFVYNLHPIRFLQRAGVHKPINFIGAQQCWL